MNCKVPSKAFRQGYFQVESKDLEQNGLVRRVVYAHQQPVAVEYLPTEYSQTLKEVIAPLVQWGAEHKRKIMKSV